MDGAKEMPAARKASGLGSWAFADVLDRARTALRKALKRAVEQIIAAHPVIGQHLGGCPRINVSSLLIASEGDGPCERNMLPAEIGSISARNGQFT